ncbi:MAG TPA: chalcone isomerase family protein [Gammaproteobacteria bacterium]|jgi:hypothetical protein
MRCLVVLSLSLALAGPAAAATLAGVTVPDTVTVANTPLLLNGVGLRTYSIFGVKIYAGALYLTQKTGDPAAVVAQAGPDRVLMHMIHAVSKKQFADAWHDDFPNNNPQAYDGLKPRVEQFLALFDDSKQGDEIAMDYVPGTGTQVYWNGSLRGTIPGEDFHKALLNCFMGPKPPTDDLKAGMLGKRD